MPLGSNPVSQFYYRDEDGSFLDELIRIKTFQMIKHSVYEKKLLEQQKMVRKSFVFGRYAGLFTIELQ